MENPCLLRSWIYEDNEYALYTLNRVADNFRTSAWEKGSNPETHESRKQELDKLVQDPESLRENLNNITMQILQVFSSWMHFYVVRLFAESILMRYGLPPSFLASVLAPSVKAEKKVRSILEALSDSTNRQEAY
ncbi:hypothetical protein RIF29_34205 [Crotalaria pallida]|uniref:V-type proton ATPase subunit C n=1 Tax=Crotalaria pallida TaxID=3830 RepID=A0AAN9HTF1_CROPI